MCTLLVLFVFFQAEDVIRDLVRSRGLGDVYKRQIDGRMGEGGGQVLRTSLSLAALTGQPFRLTHVRACLLYTSDAADERSSVDLGGRRIIKKNTLATSTAAHIVKHHSAKSLLPYNPNVI